MYNPSLIDDRSFEVPVDIECYGFSFKISSVMCRNCDERKVCGIELPGDCNKLKVGMRSFPAWMNDKCRLELFFANWTAFGP